MNATAELTTRGTWKTVERSDAIEIRQATVSEIVNVQVPDQINDDATWDAARAAIARAKGGAS